MKRIFNSFMAIAVAALAIVSCAKADQVELQEPEEGYRYSFTVVDDFSSTKGDTKAILGTTGVVWEEHDRVGMFLTGYTGYANIDMTKTPKEVVLYSKKEIPADSYAYSYYPYSTDNTDKTNTKITLSSTQVGGASSSMPMAGIPFAITETTPVTNHGTEQNQDNHAETNGSIRFLNLASIIEFNVFSSNAAYQSETVQSVTIKTSDGTILSGDGYLDLTQVSATDENSLVLNFSNANNTYDEVRVNQSAPVAATKGDATHIYMAVLPCNFSGTIIVTTDKASYTWTIADNAKKELKRNYIYHYNMNLNNATRGEVIEVVKTLPYSEPFTNNIGDFKIEDKEISSLDYVWTWGGASYGMKASAYVDKTNYATESWLVSPWISLENGIQYAAVSFDHALNFVKDNSSTLTLQVKTNESGATWEELENSNWPAGNGWTFVNSGDISLNSYVGKRIKLAFKYTSTTTEATTWEVKNFNVHVAEEPQCAIPVITFDATTNTVTIECSTTGARIGYTIDGTEPGIDDAGDPTGTTEEYTEPFTISETCTVKAFAGASGYSMSDIAEKRCVVSGETAPEPQTINFSTLNLENGVAYNDPFDGGDFTVTFHAGGNNGKYYNSGTAIRVYGGGSFTIASDDYLIERIDFTFSSGEDNNAITPSVGEFSSPVWTGEASSITFNVDGTSGHRRIKAIKVTYKNSGSGEVSTNTVSFEMGTDITSKEDLNAGVTKDGITLSATTNAWYTPLRFYAGDQMTITGATITKVKFNYSREGDTEKIQQDNKNLTIDGSQAEYWTGSSTSVVFVNNASSQARISSVVVEYTE